MKKDKTIAELKQQIRSQSACIKAANARIESLRDKNLQLENRIETLEERIRDDVRFITELKGKLQNSINKDFCLEIIRASRFELKNN